MGTPQNLLGTPQNLLGTPQNLLGTPQIYWVPPNLLGTPNFKVCKFFQEFQFCNFFSQNSPTQKKQNPSFPFFFFGLPIKIKTDLFLFFLFSSHQTSSWVPSYLRWVPP